MTALIVIRRNQFGRTPTRGKSNARPLSSGMEIINFTRHAGRWTPILRDLSGISFARVRGAVAGTQHPGHCTSFLFSGLHRAPALFQSSARAVAYVFQALPSLPCVFVHVFKEQHGATRWKEKAFPNSTKVLAKVR